MWGGGNACFKWVVYKVRQRKTKSSSFKNNRFNTKCIQSAPEQSDPTVHRWPFVSDIVYRHVCVCMCMWMCTWMVMMIMVDLLTQIERKKYCTDSKNNVKILKFVCTHIFFDNYMTYSFLKIPIILLQREG